jgi:transcription elongation factor Elf1
MGRRKRRVVKVFRRKLPRILTCPRCGNISLIVERVSDDLVNIKCGTCHLLYPYPAPKEKEYIDTYNEFIDKVNSGEIKI